MKDPHKFPFVFFGSIAAVLFAMLALLVGLTMSGKVSVLTPKGLIALKQSQLILHSTFLMLIVVVPVLVLTYLFAWIYRGQNKRAKYSPDWAHHTGYELLWWGFPCVIIAILSVMVWKSSHELDPFRPIESEVKPLRIQAVALDWKWLFLYPEQGIATVNFVQFPEKTPLNFEITADAPMNSFWIPDLGGQIYAMAGMRSKLHLMVDQVGDFRGSSANLSGAGFAGMVFTARASSEEEFHDWVQSVASSSEVLNYEEKVKPTQYDPPAYFVLDQEDLFESILKKYMTGM